MDSNWTVGRQLGSEDIEELSLINKCNLIFVEEGSEKGPLDLPGYDERMPS